MIKSELEDLQEMDLSTSDSKYFAYSTQLDITSERESSILQLYENWDEELKFYFNSQGNKKLIGIGSVKILTFQEGFNEELFHNKISRIKKQVVNIGKTKNNIIWFGGQSFDDFIKLRSDWEEWGVIYYFLPRINIVMENSSNAQITIIYDRISNEDYEQYFRDVLHKIETLLDIEPKTQKNTISKLIYETPKPEWINYVRTGLGYISENIVDKIVLSRIRSYEINSIQYSKILHDLEDSYPETFVFDMQLRSNNHFFAASPELLLRVKNKIVETYALAGSINRGTSTEEDKKLADELFNSSKNRSEHQFVIDDIISKLGMFTSDIKFSQSPKIIKLKNIQHLKTEITATLLDDYSINHLVSLLHPTPALAGLPSDKAKSLIRDIETHDRGWYGGPIGWFDSEGNGEMIVAIRSALQKERKLILYSGAGIVKDSIPEFEWEETKIKFYTIQRLFEQL